MRRTTFITFVAAFVAVVKSAHADPRGVPLTVDPGDIARTNVPVAARIDAKAIPSELLKNNGGGQSVAAVSAGNEKPILAQIEVHGEAAIVRWIAHSLEAGQPKTYTLRRVSDLMDYGVTNFKDGDGFRDLPQVYRHINRYDPADHNNTFKPFHHIFGMHGEGLITNGPGRDDWGKAGENIRFPHHRGLFFGFNKTPYGDFWHGKDGVSQRHRAYVAEREFAGPFVAREVSVSEWTTKDGKAVIRDTREVTSWRVNDKHVVLDFEIALESLTGEAIPLEGDPQHAGFQFRAANEVGDAPATQPSATAPGLAATSPATTRRATTGGGSAVYLRPSSAVGTPNDVWENCPWVHCSFTIKGNPYGVTHMDAPTNPKPTVYSTRAYGRFGAFFGSEKVLPDKPLKLRYRIMVRSGAQAPDATLLEQEYQNYTSPVKVTVAK